MLWLALHLPSLPLEAFCASLPPAPAAADSVTESPAVLAPPPPSATPATPATPAPRPVVLIDQHRVHSANPAAAQRGVRPGMKRATALALAADLLVADSNPARDAAALQAVVHAALAFTPSVCLHPHASQATCEGPTVLLEVQASLRLFGGLPRLHQAVLQAVAPLGHRVQMAAAPTALGAALLAQIAQPAPSAEKTAAAIHFERSGRWVLGPHATDPQALQRLLARAPVGLLGSLRTHASVLQGMGLHTVADLQALPRDGVARRFGQAVLDELDRALGTQKDPRRWTVPAPEFESRLELYARAETTDQVLFGAAVLLARLVAWAQARQSRVGAFTLRMLHERQRSTERGETPAATELQVPLAEPALDPVHLQLLLRERLGRCTLAEPTLELQLICRHLVAAPAPNAELFPTPGSRAEGLVRLLERLCARLGPAQVQRVLPVADFRPERSRLVVSAQGPVPTEHQAAADTVAALAAQAAAPDPHGPPPLPLHRPTWLLPEPLPLAERDALPRLQGRPLQLLSGPERIETGWWDGGLVTRDYYIAMLDDGSLVWVFRDRMPSATGEVHWFLQGRFG